MDELKELRARVQALEDKDAIRKLKAIYWICLDQKRWSDFADCFAEDAVIEVPPATRTVGRAEILKTLPQGPDSVLTAHHGHHYDIELTGETTARGIWAMYDNVQIPRISESREGYGWYEEQYVKVNGRWKIKYMTLSRIFIFTEKTATT